MTGDGGTYTLLVNVAEDTTQGVGALGEHTFEQGWYAYVGSALGPGGFARVERHRELAAGERDTRHWHIDYLLTATPASLGEVVRTTGIDAECAIADAITGDAVPEFGCSDCGCESHLYFHPERSVLRRSVEDAHKRARSTRRRR